MNYTTISIIIPVFNGERYVKKCLDSIVNQSYKNWECIVVNDGSNDNTAVILDQYVNSSTESSKFKIVHKVNEGVSVARNTGLSLAKGEWIAFSDADDYYYPRAFELLLAAAQETDTKIVLGNAERLYMDGRKTLRYPSFSVIEKRDYFPKGSIEMWGDLFHHSLFKNKDFSYVPGLAYLEDRLLMLKLLATEGEYAVCPTPIYCQYRNPYSVLTSKNGLRMARHCFWAARLMADYECDAPKFKNEVHDDSKNAIYRGCTYFYNSKNASFSELKRAYAEYFEDINYLRKLYVIVVYKHYKSKLKKLLKRIIFYKK